MSAYLVVDITVHDPEMYQEYVRKAPPYIERMAPATPGRRRISNQGEGQCIPERSGLPGCSRDQAPGRHYEHGSCRWLVGQLNDCLTLD